MSAPLDIVSIGMVTAVGLDAPSACAAMRAHVDGFQETRFLSTPDGWLTGAPVPLPRNWIGEKRIAHLAAGAIVEAFESVPEARGQTALVLCLPLGLALSLLARLLEAKLLGPAFAGEAWGHLGGALRPAAAALLAAGYVCGVMVALRSAAGRALLAPLRHVGQMALTNYVTQSFVIAFVLFVPLPAK